VIVELLAKEALENRDSTALVQSIQQDFNCFLLDVAEELQIHLNFTLYYENHSFGDVPLARYSGPFFKSYLPQTENQLVEGFLREVVEKPNISDHALAKPDHLIVISMHLVF
jgi:hypothetical protein